MNINTTQIPCALLGESAVGCLSLIKSAIAVHFTLILLNIAGMLLDGLTVEDISGGGGNTTPPPKSKTHKRKREEEDEKKEEGETETDKRVRRGGEGRERGRGGRQGWRMGRHVENVSVTITNLVYTTLIFIYNLDL